MLLASMAAIFAGSLPLYADQTSPDDADWFYTYRPSDTMQSVGNRMLNAKYTWSDLVRYNRIDNVSSLQAGSIIKIPMSWLKFQPMPAKALSVDGNVLLKKARLSNYTMLRANQLIQVGDEVMSRNGTALIKLADNSIVRLESDSHIHFNRLSHFGDTGMVDTRIRLKKGGLINTVAPLKKGSRYEISTPSAVAAVRGTEFRIRTDGNGSKIEVTEGKVEFSNSHGSRSVLAGEGAEISAQAALIETRSLYDAPEKGFKNQVISDLPTKLSWSPMPGADKYKFELMIDDGKGRMMQSKELSSPEVELDNLKSGNYQLAMRAVDSEGFQGINDLTRVTVALQGHKPALLFPLEGSVANNETLNFKWKTKDQNIKSKLEVALDPDFIDLVVSEPFDGATEFQPQPPLEPGIYHWRVVGLSQDHIETASDSRKLTVQGLMDEVRILSVNYVKNQVGLFWNSLDEASGYVLQISDNEQFKRVLREETIQKASAFLKLTAGKTYYARVKGIGNSLYDSEYGPSTELKLEATEQEQ